jgi:hypothetical protein
VWDAGLIENWPGGPSELLSELSKVAVPASDTAAPAQWAEESCRIVTSNGVYPSEHKIGADYVRRMAPVLKERLAAAGRRLAALLDGSLGDR